MTRPIRTEVGRTKSGLGSNKALRPNHLYPSLEVVIVPSTRPIPLPQSPIGVPKPSHVHRVLVVTSRSLFFVSTIRTLHLYLGRYLGYLSSRTFTSFVFGSASFCKEFMLQGLELKSNKWAYHCIGMMMLKRIQKTIDYGTQRIEAMRLCRYGQEE